MAKKTNWNRRIPGFENAAASVLRGIRNPLTVREISDILLAKKLIKTTGKTPEKTLYAVIQRSNRRSEKLGRKPIFKKIKEGARVRYVLNKK